MPAHYPAVLEVGRTVSNQARISFRGNSYSVPPGHTGCRLLVRHRLGELTLDLVTDTGVVLARHRRAADGAGAVVLADEHVAALEKVALANFADRPPCRRKHRRPPYRRRRRWPRPTGSASTTSRCMASRWWPISQVTPQPPGKVSTIGREAATYQRLRDHLHVLRLSAAAEALPGMLDDAREKDLSTVAMLEQLLAIEVETTQARRLASRLRFACLPTQSRLDEFDFSAQPGVDEKLIRELASLPFLDDAGNVVFVGPPGTGKTMLAIGLARAAAEAGHRVYFTTADDLTKRRHKAALEGRWATCMRFLCGPRLLVIDEFAYARRNPDPEANTALFEVISRRYLKSSTILTSHTGIAGWGERLGDPMLAAAVLDLF